MDHLGGSLALGTNSSFVLAQRCRMGRCLGQTSNAPWFFHGHHCTDGSKERWIYEFNIGDEKLRFRICPWQRTPRFEPPAAKLPTPRWWEASSPPVTVSPTLPFSPKVAATCLDAETQGSEIVDDLQTERTNGKTGSPEPKKPKVEGGIRAGYRGPAGTTVLDCGGAGDCGYRVLAFTIAMQNSKWQSEIPEVCGKAEAMGLSLRGQVAHTLTHVHTLERVMGLGTRSFGHNHYGRWQHSPRLGRVRKSSVETK